MPLCWGFFGKPLFLPYWVNATLVGVFDIRCGLGIWEWKLAIDKSTCLWFMLVIESVAMVR